MPIHRRLRPLVPSEVCRPATSTSGDLVYDGEDGTAKLYRQSENTTYSLLDLLDDDSRVQFCVGSYPNKIGMPLINNSNVAGVPQADPYDHIAGAKYYPSLGWRAFILVPVELP